MNVQNSVNRLFGNNQTNQTQQKVNKMYGQNTEFNPFVNKKTGQIINPYANYSPVLNASQTSQKVKEWITKATGETPLAEAESNNFETNGEFNTNLDITTLGNLDIATQLPKLSTSQISKIIQTHFGNSPVISTSDAEGIYNAQKTTGMSALAILGIGALESGWGTSDIAKKTNNMWGYGATNINPLGNAHRYGQMSQGAAQFASEFMKTYYNGYGLKSIGAVGSGGGNGNIAYAQDGNGNASTTWAPQVTDIMGKLYNTAKGVGGINGISKATSKGQEIVNAAQGYMGTPYVWGGSSRDAGGLDCSGFVYKALNDAGYKVDRETAQGYRRYGKSVAKANMQPGDLIFFGSGNYASHIGIYLGNGQMIHSSGGRKNTASNPGKGVSITNINYRNDFIEARRVA